MRIQLSGLFRSALLKKGSAAESLRARRERTARMLKDPSSGAGRFPVAGKDERDERCRCYGCTAAARMLTR